MSMIQNVSLPSLYAHIWCPIHSALIMRKKQKARYQSTQYKATMAAGVTGVRAALKLEITTYLFELEQMKS